MAEILVVDDEEPVRFMLKQALVKAGHTVREADTGRKAIALLESVTPDLMITDIIMPDMEGLETILEAKAKHPDLPIIAMSGGGRMGNTNYLELAEKFGAVRVFAKPFDTAQMLKAVNEAIGSMAPETPAASG